MPPGNRSADAAPPADASRVFARQLAAEAIAIGDAIGWFETLYAAAEQGTTTVPWVDREPNPHLVFALAGRPGPGRAIVVGCGMGDDAEHVASLGYATVAFDVSATAVAGARRRFPDSAVDYVAADLIAPPESWIDAFDLVVEAYTLQVLTGTARRTAFARTAELVVPGGRLLVIARARDDDEDPGQMPWPLTRGEVESFRDHGLTMESIVEVYDDGPHRARRWLAWFRR
jgi:hypothetical protein